MPAHQKQGRTLRQSGYEPHSHAAAQHRARNTPARLGQALPPGGLRNDPHGQWRPLGAVHFHAHSNNKGQACGKSRADGKRHISPRRGQQPLQLTRGLHAQRLPKSKQVRAPEPMGRGHTGIGVHIAHDALYSASRGKPHDVQAAPISPSDCSDKIISNAYNEDTIC